MILFFSCVSCISWFQKKETTKCTKHTNEERIRGRSFVSYESLVSL